MGCHIRRQNQPSSPPSLVSKGTKRIPKATSWQGACCWTTVVTYIPCPVPNAIPFHWAAAQRIWLSRQLRLTPASPESAHGGNGSGHLYNIPIPQGKPGFCNHQLQELCLWLMSDLQAQEWKKSTTRVSALLPQPQTELRRGGQVKGCIRCCGEGSSKLSPTEKDFLALVSSTMKNNFIQISTCGVSQSSEYCLNHVIPKVLSAILLAQQLIFYGNWNTSKFGGRPALHLSFLPGTYPSQRPWGNQGPNFNLSINECDRLYSPKLIASTTLKPVWLITLKSYLSVPLQCALGSFTRNPPLNSCFQQVRKEKEHGESTPIFTASGWGM